MRGFDWLRPLSLLLALLILRPALAAEPDLGTDLGALPAASYADKKEIIGRLAALHQPGTRALLSALLEGNVYARQKDGKVFVGAAVDAGLALVDPLTGQAAGTEPADGFDRIGINNSLRKVLRTAIAKFDLDSSNTAVRKAAVADILHSLDESGVALLGERLKVERDSGVKAEIQTGIALAALDSTSTPQRLAAVDRLSRSLNPDVLQPFDRPDGPGYRTGCRGTNRRREGTTPH